MRRDAEDAAAGAKNEARPRRPASQLHEEGQALHEQAGHQPRQRQQQQCTLGTLLIGPHPKPIPPLILSSCGVINVLQYSLVGPLHDAMSKVHKYSVYGGVLLTARADGPASPPLGPAHGHTATVAHSHAYALKMISRDCRAQNEDVPTALDCLTSPM